MTLFNESTTAYPNCPRCDSVRLRYWGTQQGKRVKYGIYECLRCGTRFTQMWRVDQNTTAAS